MKKLISGMVLSALVAPAFGAPVPVASEKMTFGDTIASWFDGTWYMGGRASLSMMNWKNETSTSVPGDSVSDDSFSEVVFGGAAFVGHEFNENWRGEVEAGLMGHYEEEEAGTTFKLSVPYVMINAMYDFTEPQVQGLYVGGGLGFALPKTQLQSVFFSGGDSSERAFSPMFGLMAGWSFDLDDNLVLDLRYRLSMLWGTEHERQFINLDDYKEYVLKNEIGFILDNSISLGLRYEF